GFHVNTTPAFALACREGHEASVHTSLVVLEDALTLFGFASRDGGLVAAARRPRR
uniref:OB-fold domain-containing protein n=1 Tax=Agromyces humi TaxID=1766800 RepID=UPI002E272ADA